MKVFALIVFLVSVIPATAAEKSEDDLRKWIKERIGTAVKDADKVLKDIETYNNLNKDIRRCARNVIALTLLSAGQAVKMTPEKLMRLTPAQIEDTKAKMQASMNQASSALYQILHGLVMARDKDEHQIITACMTITDHKGS